MHVIVHNAEREHINTFVISKKLQAINDDLLETIFLQQIRSLQKCCCEIISVVLCDSHSCNISTAADIGMSFILYSGCERVGVLVKNPNTGCRAAAGMWRQEDEEHHFTYGTTFIAMSKKTLV